MHPIWHSSCPNANAVETARQVFVHRNTFRYQIGRIGEILGMGLDDPVVRLSLEIALRAISLDLI